MLGFIQFCNVSANNMTETKLGKDNCCAASVYNIGLEFMKAMLGWPYVQLFARLSSNISWHRTLICPPFEGLQGLNEKSYQSGINSFLLYMLLPNWTNLLVYLKVYKVVLISQIHTRPFYNLHIQQVSCWLLNVYYNV